MKRSRASLCLGVMAVLMCGMPVHASPPSDAPRALVTDASTRIIELTKRTEGQAALNDA